ncbi:predicted protein [Sclerotinia sclerotiorum 1980 UF-70]|uniref:Uncharacterized protein n=1 Tax=Sclerotinia sclerotiorum (strain ATCC 18683 / 1980 / Ss-1) TaxID=665079 RepID=A7EXG9_SCLS1|nr:predicted protein [Sclerotinia sclerotiorum 1980 UF-70]EDN94161.1 predicted protein [Sclerotinia sclerotiorum 1980 UF-70]
MTVAHAVKKLRAQALRMKLPRTSNKVGTCAAFTAAVASMRRGRGQHDWISSHQEDLDCPTWAERKT